MQPKFTLNTRRNVLTRIFAFALILFLSTQFSFGQKSEEMRRQLTQTDAFINPPTVSATSTPVVVPYKFAAQPANNGTQRIFAPTVIATPGPPTYPGNNSRGFTNSFVSFAVRNTNGFAIVIQALSAYFDPAVIGGNPSGSSMTLWYSATSLGGDPTPIGGPTWQIAGTSTLGAIGAAGVYPVMTGLTLQIPANTSFRFCMQSTLGVTYSGTGTGAGTPSPNNFSAGGVDLLVGDATLGSGNIGYAGDAPAGTTFNARYFMGDITFDQAVCIPTNATQPIISSVPSSTCAGSPITLSIISGSLNGAGQWRWYTGSCGGTLVGTGSSITVSPGATTTYFVRGEGGCAPAPGPCGQQTVTVTPCTCLTPDVATICSGSIQQLSVTPSGVTTPSFGPGPAVAIPSSGNGSPYPSTINVAGLPTAGVYVQSVAINGFSHTWPEDVDIALLSPSGQMVILMSDVGGANAIGPTNLVINDAGAAFTANIITPGVYKPTNLVGVFGVEPDNFPAPGLGTNVSGTTLSSFSSSNNANGQWRLLALDDTGGDLGSLTGWNITFRVVPTATWTSNPAAPNTMFTNPGATVAYGGGQADVIWVNPTTTTTYTATFSGGACAPTQSVTVTVLPRPNIQVSPNPGGCAPVTLTATGGIAYTWTPGTGLSATTGSTVVATPSTDQTYTVLGYGANGCSNTTTVPVKGISTAAVITAAPAFLTYIDESFNAAALPAGWSQQNNSQPVGVPPFNDWHQGTTGGVWAPQSPPDFREVAFLSGSGLATLSNWLISPVVPFEQGNVLSFYTIALGQGFPDRMQIRHSVTGASTNVGATATSLGDFTTLIDDINPTYSQTGYPLSWTEKVYTLGTAYPAGTTGRIAFRYFVENGGPAGANSNVVGLDGVKYRKPLPGVCPNTVGTISVNITGGVAPYTLVFTNGTTNTTFPAYTSGTPIQVSPNVTTNYTIVSVTGANGCLGVGNTGVATINVIQPPAITAQPASTAVCVGGSATFTVTATPAVSSTTYFWEFSTNGGATWNPATGAPYSGGNTATLTVNPVTAGMNGYRFRVTVGGQCPPQPVISNGLATLQVNVPPTINTQPSNVTVCDGKTATFTVAASTTVGTVSYQWQQSVDGGVTWGNAPGASATTASYSFTATLLMTGYRYRVVVSVAPCASTATSNIVILTVNPLPVVTITSADLAITPGQTTTITGTSNPAASATGWSWTLNGNVVPAPPAPPANTSTLVVGIDGLGVYQATATTAVTGCTNTSNLLTIGAEASDHVWIYPNPNNGNFQIRLYFDGNVAERRRVRIYNALGQLVAQKEFDLVQGSPSYLKMEFQLPRLAAGTYVAKVSGLNSGSIVSGLFVVAQ